MPINEDFGWLIDYRFLTIDPGVGTGWSLFSGEFMPESTGIFRTDPDDCTTVEQLFTLKQYYRETLDSLCPDVVVIEDCEYRPSHKGIVSAGSGALALLAKIVGAYVALTDCQAVLVPANAWKGNLPEEVVRKRVVRALNRQYREHEQEAVGIGLAIWGRF